MAWSWARREQEHALRVAWESEVSITKWRARAPGREEQRLCWRKAEATSRGGRDFAGPLARKRMPARAGPAAARRRSAPSASASPPGLD
jgi:hypothetical protein